MYYQGGIAHGSPNSYANAARTRTQSEIPASRTCPRRTLQTARPRTHSRTTYIENEVIPFLHGFSLRRRRSGPGRCGGRGGLTRDGSSGPNPPCPARGGWRNGRGLGRGPSPPHGRGGLVRHAAPHRREERTKGHGVFAAGRKETRGLSGEGY